MPDAGTSTERLLRDVHPAELLLPDGQRIVHARVFVTSERIVAWTSAPNSAPVMVAEVPLADLIEATRSSMPVGGTIVLSTPGGNAFLGREQGCGCGSPLKALAPPVSWTRR